MGKLTLKSNLLPQENQKLRSDFTKRLAERLKELRKNKGMTQQELSNAAGLHLTYLGHLELARYHPTVFIMWKISKALGVKMDDLTDV